MEVIKINDERYPEKLRSVYCPPKQLYVEGNSKILNDFSIAIIGARECTTYGKRVTKYFSEQLSENNVNIISGLARGIDSVAHRGCFGKKGKTIAVLGSGINYIYPPENVEIYNEILRDGGAIVSEYPLGVKPSKTHFPARNRIISGLSNGVLVVEARKKSGTLITVDFALEQGKEVFIIPGNIDQENSVGTNLLIQQGAKLVTCVEDILEEFKMLEFE